MELCNELAGKASTNKIRQYAKEISVSVSEVLATQRNLRKSIEAFFSSNPFMLLELSDESGRLADVVEIDAECFERIEHFAESKGVPLGQFIVDTVCEKLSCAD